MKKLEDYTEEELLAAIEAKKHKEEIPEVLLTNSLVHSSIWKNVIGLAIEQRDRVAKEGRPVKDIKQYIFEEVMKTVFGKDYFKWENKYNKGE